MKLAFILFRYFPYGGLQRDFLRIAQACIAGGHNVHVFTMECETSLQNLLPVTIVPVKGLQNHTRIEYFVKKLKNILKQQYFDLRIGFNKMPELDIYYAADTCFQAKSRSQHAAWFRLTPRYRSLLANEQAVCQGKTNILLLSKKQQQDFQKFYQTPTEQMYLLPPGIAKDRLVKNLAAKTMSYQLLLIGSGFRTKGLDRAIIALANLPKEIRNKAKLTVIGYDKAHKFRLLAKKLNISAQINFLGGRDDIPYFLQNADILLHPARNENTGTVLLEALASGLPVITTDVCGYAHYITAAKAGKVLKSPFKQEELNKTLLEMLQNPTIESLRANAFNFAKNSDIYSLPQHAVSQIENFSKQCLPKNNFLGNNTFLQIMSLKGEVYRKHKNRKTQQLLINNDYYFLKQHYAIGWREIFKSILSGHLPIIDAKPEKLALRKLHTLKISTPDVVHFGIQGLNPAKRQSYLLTKALPAHTTLEQLAKNPEKISLKFKWRLINKVALIAGTMHKAGINHRDFYLCHLLVDQSSIKLAKNCHEPKIHIIDLHRACIRTKIPLRWQIKDLAGLDFSSRNAKLTLRDKIRFIRSYEKAFSVSLDSTIWQKVIKRGDKLYRKHGL